MDLQTVTDYYGEIAVFIIVMLEYLSLPGFPAGIIMPAAVICASQVEYLFCQDNMYCVDKKDIAYSSHIRSFFAKRYESVKSNEKCRV